MFRRRSCVDSSQHRNRLSFVRPGFPPPPATDSLIKSHFKVESAERSRSGGRGGGTPGNRPNEVIKSGVCTTFALFWVFFFLQNKRERSCPTGVFFLLFFWGVFLGCFFCSPSVSLRGRFPKCTLRGPFRLVWKSASPWKGGR